jgi:hypothetical protein
MSCLNITQNQKVTTGILGQGEAHPTAPSNDMLTPSASRAGLRLGEAEANRLPYHQFSTVAA